MPGLVGPERFPIRQPDDPSRVNGRNVNPVRYMEIGGLTGASKWFGGDDSKKNTMSVERATSVRAAREARKNDDTND